MCENLACHLCGQIQGCVLAEFASHKWETRDGWHSQMKGGDSVMWLRDWYLFLRASLVIILVNWALSWRCVYKTKSYSTNCQEATETWPLSGWGCFLGGIWIHILTLSKDCQPQPCGPNPASFLFFYSPHTKVGFYISTKIFKNQRNGNIFEVFKLLWNSNFSVHK